MPLTDEKKQEIRATLTANADTRAGKTWQGVNLDEVSDEQLIAFNELATLLDPVENGIACPCGRTAVFNEGKHKWEHDGTPKAVKMPATTAEYYAAGGGTAEEREMFEFTQNEFRNRKTEILEQLTANMTEAEREETWNEYKDLSLAALTKMLKRFVKPAQEQQRTPTANYFGGQGAPFAAAPTNIQPLIPPTLDFPHPGKKAKTG